VRQGFEAAVAKEAAGALNRVDRAENARQHLPRIGVGLQRQKIGVQPVEVLVALHEELGYDVVHLAHGDLFPG
jgi:hypothetical protein